MLGINELNNDIKSDIKTKMKEWYRYLNDWYSNGDQIPLWLCPACPLLSN